MKTLLLTALLLTVSQAASASYWDRAKEVFYPSPEPIENGSAICTVTEIKDKESIVTATETHCLIHSVNNVGNSLFTTTMSTKVFSDGSIETTTRVKLAK